jgi:predicted small secreted protein
MAPFDAAGSAVTSHDNVNLGCAVWRWCRFGPPDHDTHERIITIRTKLSITLALLVLIGAAPLIGACHTTAGAGEDISATGHVITHIAVKNTP